MRTVRILFFSMFVCLEVSYLCVLGAECPVGVRFYVECNYFNFFIFFFFVGIIVFYVGSIL
jgi:hypothetical protein